MSARQFAIVTGASTGIGLELAKCCARENFDLLIAADEAEIDNAAAEIRKLGANVSALQADLSTTEGVDKLYAAANGRPVDALLANAGRGLGRAFLDQDFKRARLVIDTNVTGTVYLIHKIGNDMRARNAGKILITGSIAGFNPRQFPGGLQRHQSVPGFVLLCASGGASRYRGHRDLPYAGRDRNQVLRARRHDGYKRWNG
jgi:short-subunit dehydrogenase